MRNILLPNLFKIENNWFLINYNSLARKILMNWAKEMSSLTNTTKSTLRDPVLNISGLLRKLKWKKASQIFCFKNKILRSLLTNEK
jgi:hypothetical protein